jgi:hypothetical protein
MLVRCTKRAQTRLRLKVADLVDVPDAPAGPAEWYCNVAVLERRPFFLLTHASTLFAFWMPVAGSTAPDVFGRRAREHAGAALASAGVDASKAGHIVGEGPVVFAKTRDRRVLGSMVDQVHMTKACLAYDGGLGQVGVDGLNESINEAPMSAIAMQSPRIAILRLLGAGSL